MARVEMPSLSSDLPWQLSAYLLIDGVSVEQLLQRIYQWYENPDFELLYRTTALEPLADISPCLISLSGPDDPGLRQFLSNAQQEWGYLIFSDASQVELMAHLRALLHVKVNGQPAYLRVADPATIDALLTLESSSHLLGPIVTVVTPDRISNQWRIHTQSQRHITLKIPTPYTLTDEQINALGAVSFRQNVIELNSYLLQSFPGYAEHLELDQRWQHIHTLATQAYAQGFCSALDITQYARIHALLGENALQEHHDIAALVLEPSSRTPSQRIEFAAQIAQLRAQKLLPIPEQLSQGVVR
ncbi:DUF4123 domain-containing protein [Pseudomonas sp. MS19]|nr:DUF4123 domain-containing protein [Pseudomonas sp. MS19]